MQSLKFLNTFSINSFANRIVIARFEKELIDFWKQAIKENKPVMLLGGGSNVLFLENYSGTIILNRIKGISVTDDHHSWYIHANSGEIWHNLVVYSLHRNMPGLENLALIPGYVGSAPIQNIGAYGLELNEICEYLDVLNLKTEKKYRLTAKECQFSYRESIFKHNLKNGHAIVTVGLRLKKVWNPVLNYSFLRDLYKKDINPFNIFNLICAVRRKILPDPSIIGNAGSFFKNPIIPNIIANNFLKKYPNALYFPQEDGTTKILAEWLIESCHLKGYQMGRAAVYKKKASILINSNYATGREIFKLAQYVHQCVANKFSILLEPEVRFISSKGEINLSEILI